MRLKGKNEQTEYIFHELHSPCMYVDLHECWLVQGTALAAIKETKGMEVGVLFKQKGSNQSVIM